MTPPPVRWPIPAPLAEFRRAWCQAGFCRPPANLLVVWVASQRMDWWVWRRAEGPPTPPHRHQRVVVSTSRFGVGQIQDSCRTPLGLHRIARKIGAGWPPGTVFESRQSVGFTWAGRPGAPIAHRILWLEGLQPGFNRGDEVDSFRRFIYIHGVGDELTLGRPASRGCIHLAAHDLLSLYDRLPVGTPVWICAGHAHQAQ